MLDLVHIRSFISIIETGGFQSAARQLGLAQPTVSQHLRKLEEALGVALVVRSNAHCHVTAKGAAFLPNAKRLMELQARAVASVHGDRLNIGAASNIGVYMLPGIVKTYLEVSVDQAQVAYSIGSNQATLAALKAGRCDLALMEWWPEEESEFEAFAWHREQLLVIVPPGHRWAGKSIPLQDLAKEPMLGGEPGTGTGRILRSALSSIPSCSLEIAAELGSTEAVKKAVAAGLGVSVVLKSTVVDEIRAGSLATCNVVGAALEKVLYCALPAATPETSRARKLQQMLLHRAEGRTRHVPVTSNDYVS